jgi:DNA polymerase-4
MKKERAIVHMDLDTFFVSCERLLDSRLNGKPILIGGTSDRGVVASCSYEARKFGIHSAMPMKMALQRCPEAIVIKGNSQTYTKYSRIVTEIIQESAPVYEKSSIDEFFLDFSGMDRFFGCKKYADELRERVIRESGLPISFGLSENKTVSKIATGEAKPNNAINVNYGNERLFLAPLSIRKIPSIGLKTYQTFCGLGVKKIHTLQEMPVELLEQVFGKNGRTFWRKAHGIDNSPVIQYNERKSISTERTFDHDTIDILKIKAILSAMGENLAFQLRGAQKVCACVTVKVRYSDFQTKTLQRKIPYTAADHEIIPLVLELFDKVYYRRVRIRLIGVRLSHLVNGNHQINLFTDDTRQSDLYHAMDKIRARFGDRSVMRAAGMTARTIGGSNSFNGEPPVLLPNRRV